MKYETAKKAYKDGRYVEAVESALEALEKNPEYEEARQILVSAFNEGTAAYLAPAEKNAAESDPVMLDLAVGYYDKLIAMNNFVKAAGNSDVSYTDYQPAQTDVRLKLIAAHYETGKKRLASGDYKQARMAIDNFNYVAANSKDYADIQALLKNAQAAAVVDVAVSAGEAGGEWEQYVFSRLTIDSKYTDDIADHEFINLLPAGTYKGSSLDLMLKDLTAGKIDIVIQIQKPEVSINFKKVENHNVPLPVGNPVIECGYEQGVDYNNSFKANYKIYAKGTDNKAAVVDQGTFSGTDSGSYRVYRVYWVKEDVKLSFDGDQNYWDLAYVKPGLDAGSAGPGLYSLKADTNKFWPDYEDAGSVAELEKKYFDEFFGSFDRAYDYFGSPTFIVIDGYYYPDDESYSFLDGSNYSESRAFRDKSSPLLQAVSYVMYQLCEQDKKNPKSYYPDLTSDLNEYIITNF